MNSLGISITAASLFYYAYMIQDNRTALVATFGELESTFDCTASFPREICETPGYSYSDIYLYLYSDLA